MAIHDTIKTMNTVGRRCVVYELTPGTLRDFCLNHCPHPKTPCKSTPCKEYRELKNKIQENNTNGKH